MFYMYIWKNDNISLFFPIRLNNARFNFYIFTLNGGWQTTGNVLNRNLSKWNVHIRLAN